MATSAPCHSYGKAGVYIVTVDRTNARGERAPSAFEGW